MVRSNFGKTTDGKPVSLYTCSNAKGATAKFITYGARLLSLELPDKKGKLANVVLTLPDVAAYEKHTAHIGGVVGRYANRIAGGKFTLDGKTYTLAKNNGPNHLHGGVKGFDFVNWKGKELKTTDGCGVEFTYTSKDGEEGYPGNLKVTAKYHWTDTNELRMEYSATTDKPTVVNLTNHSYWNLAGTGDVLGHELMIDAASYLPIDATSIPLGEIRSVDGSVMDFQKMHPIGERIDELKKDRNGTRGYDHCYVLSKSEKPERVAARLKDPKSGRVMELWTTEPGLQLYVSNFMDGSATNGGYVQHSAVCLETQHFPDSPNKKQFPSTVLRPGEIYTSTTVHRFFTE